MNQFINDRQVILAELGSIMTRFPQLRAGQIIVNALFEAGRVNPDTFYVEDWNLALALKAYNDKLHEEAMNGRGDTAEDEKRSPSVAAKDPALP